MILKKLTMCNFRQFRGTQEMVFASTEETPGKNITVIFGENGRGKTGVFRALMFCLYDERQLSQDGDLAEDELALANRHELESRSSAENDPVRSYVELAFSHGHTAYVLRRGVLAMRHNARTIEERDEVRLTVQKYGSNTEVITDPQQIARHVNDVLDHGVREYFLFDGEKIERLTRASAQQRQEVSKGIRNLLNIDALESAIRGMDTACRNLNREIEGRSTGEYRKVVKQISDTTDNLSEIRKRIEEIDAESERAAEQKQKVDKELAKYQDIASLLKERRELEQQRADVEEKLAGLLAEIRTKTGKTGAALIQDTLLRVFRYIDERKKKGEIPPEIRGDLIEKLLADKACICGRDIHEGTEPHRRILEWLKRSGDASVSDAALELWRHLASITSRIDDDRQSAETLLQRQAETKHELRRIETTLEELAQQIGGSERQDAAQLESHRSSIEGKMVALMAEKQRLQGDLERLTAELDRLTVQRKRLEKDEGHRSELISRYDLASEVASALQSVFDDFKVEIKNRLGKEATEILARLLDRDGRSTLKQVVVKDDYSLQIMDRWGDQFLANISAGQRQIMSISFIAALAKAAAGGQMLEMPLFMDTPFGRLSFDHRKNLILEIPDLCAQWILLATDTELRRLEATLLLSNGRWGKFYLLKGTGEGSTVIEERMPREAISILRQEQESPR